MTIHYGVIGCGMMGQEHLRNIALLPDAVVAAIFEPDPEMAGRAQQYAPDATIFRTLDALLGHAPLDCLLIASPNFCHIDQLEAIAAKLCLPILVEKPLFTDSADLSRIQTFKQNYGAPVWVAMEYRYMPPMQEFLMRVKDVTGGVKMLTIVEHRYPFLSKVGNWNRFNRNSGGTLVEKCCHFFDLMRLTLKSDPVRVMASAGQMVNHLDEAHEGEVPDIWDSGYAIFDFACGARTALELSMFAEGSKFQEMVHAVGPDGKMEVKVPGPGRFWTGPEDQRPVAELIASPRAICNPTSIECPVDETILAAGDHNGSTYYQHVKFADVVQGKAKVEVSLDDGIWAVRMGQAAQMSAISGQAITF